MFKKMKMNMAARNVKNTKRKPATKKNKRPSFWGRVWGVICWPFRKIAQLARRLWAWVKTLDLIALANLALLVAIIVLFSMLIIDIVGCRKKPVVVIAEPVPVVQQANTAQSATTRKISQRKPVLPLKQNAVKNQVATERAPMAVNVVPVKKCEVEIAKKQIARQNNKFYGDVIIDSRGAGRMLGNGAMVKGNLYLQNMRKYTLPCDIRVDGNLFLRDVNMLQFCGDFVVTGNIYVSPRSSFGPIPKNARLGGQVVL